MCLKLRKRNGERRREQKNTKYNDKTKVLVVVVLKRCNHYRVNKYVIGSIKEKKQNELHSIFILISISSSSQVELPNFLRAKDE